MSIHSPNVILRGHGYEVWSCPTCDEKFDIVCDPSDMEVMDDGGYSEHFEESPDCKPEE